MADLYEQAKGLDLNEGVNKAGTFWDRYKGLFGGQQADTSGFLGRFTGAIQGQEPLTHMYDRIGREIGLPTLQQNALQANQHMANIPDLYSGATRGFDVSANALGRTIGTKQAAYAPVAANANLAYGNAQNTLGQRMGFEQTQQAKLLQPYQTEQQFLTDRFARETTGFTTAIQSELNAIIDKMSKGITLTEGERQRANAMAIQKLQYDAQMAQIASSEKISGNNLAFSREQANKNPWGI